MRRFADIESAGRRYLELRQTRSSIGGIDLVSSRGEVCLKCGGGPSTLVKAGPAEKPNRWKWMSICADCREPWEGEPVEIMSRWVSSSKQIGAIEDQIIRSLDEWRVLRRIFEQSARRGEDGHRFAPGRWDFALKAFLIYTQPQWASYERVVEWGDEFETQHEMRPLYTVKRVRHAIPRAKAVVQRRGQEEGIVR